MSNVLLAIDQGTTSTRTILFSAAGQALAQSQLELQQFYPADGWVEHNAEEIWNATVQVCRTAIQKAGLTAGAIASCGITNQRETTVIWDRQTGKPIHNAIVWQDRRTADHCRQLVADGAEDTVTAKTGLLLDPYFSATKIAWILDNVDGARARAERGELACGTIDSYLLWKLTNGQVHATDATNASRTSLFNIHSQSWDEELLSLFNVPANLLPEVKDSAADYGNIDASLFGRAIPIGGVAGDQQAATVGQACFSPGMIKSTYGTGCFVMLNTGQQAHASTNRLLTTVAYRLNGEVTYALEGSIFVAGAAVQWLRDAMKLVSDAAETEALASSINSTDGVYLVPAFTGLGAPYWDPDARGALLGMSRDSGVAHIVRATLESVCYQTRDLLDAMAADASAATTLRVDGGMVANNWLTQYLADTLAIPVERPRVTETTALGAAYLAGLQAGVYSSLEEIGQQWACEQQFQPNLADEQRQQLYQGWQKAVARVRSN